MKQTLHKNPIKQNININIEKQDGNQLEILLKTNKILINSKKNIYQTKITTYEKQIQKITNMLNANLNKNKNRDKLESSNLEDEDGDEEENNQQEDEEERQALMDKLRSIQVKKQEAVAKLEALNTIEQDIKMEEQEKNQRMTKKITNFDNDKENKYLERAKNSKQSKQKLREMSMKKKLVEREQKQWRIRQKEAKTISINSSKNYGNSSMEFSQDLPARKRISDIVSKGNREEQISKYFVIDSSNKQQAFMLWTQNQQKPSYQEDFSEFNEYTMKSNKTHSRKSLKKQKIPVIYPPQQKKRSGKSLYLTSTPISVTKDQNKQSMNTESILQQQYLIILEQIYNIVDTINQFQYSHQSGQKNQQRIARVDLKSKIDENVGIKNLFRFAYQYLLKIREAIKQNNVTLSALSLQNKKYEQYQKIQREKQKEDYLRQKQNKKQQKQLNNIINKLKSEQNLISEELLSIQNQCQVYCTKIEERQKYYRDITKKIEESQSCRKQIQGNMGDVMKMYEKNMTAIEKQLRQVYDSISRTERQPTARSSSNPKKKQSQNHTLKFAKITPRDNVVQQKISNISHMHEYIRSAIQSQKMTFLQNKQSLLSQEYQIGLLKGDQKRLEGKCQQLLEKIEKLTLQCEENNRQVAKSTKQKQKMAKLIQCLTKDTEEYENLLAIKKNGYEELDSKYNSLKSKKNKLQKSLKDIESQFEQKQLKSRKIDEYLEKRQQILQNINEEVRSKLREKEDLIRDIEISDNLAVEKENNLKKTDELIAKKQEQLKKLEKKLVQIELAIENLKQTEIKKNASLEKKQEELKEKKALFDKNSESLQKIMAKVSDHEEIINQQQNRIEELQKQMDNKQILLAQQKQSHKELSSKLISVQEEIKNMEEVRQSLQQTIGVLLQKKEEAIQYIGSKYQELQKMEAGIQEICLDFQQKQQIRQGKLNEIQELEADIDKLKSQNIRLTKQNNKNMAKLQNVFSLLQENRDEQQNLQQRIKKYKQIESKLLLQIAVRAFSQSQDQDTNQPHLSSLLPTQIKHQIEFQLEQLKQARNMKQLYEKQKQENRRLKFDNERLKKLYQIDMQVEFQSCGSVGGSRNRNQSYSSSRVNFV